MFLRVRPHGTKTWLIEYEFSGRRTKYTIGVYDREGAPGDRIPDWLRHGQALYGRAVNNALATLFARGALPNVTVSPAPTISWQLT